MNLNHVQREILSKLLANKFGFFVKPKSFYIHGKTGCGKTTVMERYIWELSQTKQHEEYLSMHFHDYLLDVAKLLVRHSPEEMAKKIAAKIRILCFDEFFIEAIADAKILYDVFSSLIKHGVSIILTSNFPPEDLYKGGFNREIMFPKFSDFLREKTEVIHVQNVQDYRLQGGTFSPIAFESISAFEEAFAVNCVMNKELLTVDDNHTVKIVGRFNSGVVVHYADVIKTHASIKDYRKLARTFKHIHIAGMQSFTYENEDEAIRFRNLVDIIYTRGMVLSFDGTSTINLFTEKMLENIKFKRCYSRLNEMQSEEYLFSNAKDFKRSLTIHSAEFFERLLKLG